VAKGGNIAAFEDQFFPERAVGETKDPTGGIGRVTLTLRRDRGEVVKIRSYSKNR